MARKAAKGSGTIRKKIVTRNDKQYEYWEARVTVGRDPGSGKQIQKSITGKTQAEVRRKLQQLALAVEDKTYKEPVKLTVGQWFDIWLENYLTGRKLSTVASYRRMINNHVRPVIGAVPLVDLSQYHIQILINGLNDLSPKSIRLIHGIIHACMGKALDLGYVSKNPAGKIELPRNKGKEMQPLSDEDIRRLLAAVKGSDIENIVKLALLTGMRKSEILGLTWDCINPEAGTITIDKQLADTNIRKFGIFVSPKSGKPRVISPAPVVFRILEAEKLQQMKKRLAAGIFWNNDNNLVFTSEDGGIYTQNRLTGRFYSLSKSAGIPCFRFHDLRHTYAVNAIRAGDDAKTIQETLGHSSAAFTMDIYAHYTQDMRKASAARMENFAASFLDF